MSKQQVMTQAQFISAMRGGDTVTLEAEDGFHAVTHSGVAGYYTVDGFTNHTLAGITEWFGTYHAQYGAAVFFPKGV